MNIATLRGAVPLGEMVTASGYLVCTMSFSYIVDSEEMENSRSPQPALLLPGPHIANALYEHCYASSLIGTEVLFVGKVEVSGCLSASACGLFFGKLIDITTVEFQTVEDGVVRFVVGPDLHTRYRLLLLRSGNDRLAVLRHLREHLKLSLTETKVLLDAAPSELAAGLKEDLLPLWESLSALGAEVSLVPIGGGA
jgi:hypothetical protein